MWSKYKAKAIHDVGKGRESSCLLFHDFMSELGSSAPNLMNTKTDTEAPPARTQWIAESLHREKYFDICQNSSNFSSLSLFMPKLTVTLSCHSQRIAWSEFRARAELLKLHFRTKFVITSIFCFARKYFLLLLLRVVHGSKEKESSYQLFIFFQRIITTSLMGQLRPFSYNSVLLKPQNLCSQSEFIIHIKPKLKSVVAKTFQMLF